MAFAALPLHSSGEVSVTWDESSDLGIVDCIRKSGTAFACLDDISQTRLPFLIHAAVGPARENRARPHYLVSFAFALLTLFALARRLYGPAAALAMLIVKSWSRVVLAALAMCFTIQLVDVARFFPHFLFYGSQYGSRFIGEFYGLRAQEPDAHILAADHNILFLDDPRLVPTSRPGCGCSGF